MSETLIIIFVILIGSVFCFVLLLFIANPARKKLTYLKIFRKDPGYDIIHIFGARRIMPEDGDSYDIWHYRVLDLRDMMIYEGANQKGNDLDLESPFAQRALNEMSKNLKKELSFDSSSDDDTSASLSDHDDDDSENPLPVKVIKRKATTSDTEKVKATPADTLLFIETSSDTPSFTMELIRSGRSVAVHKIKGVYDYFFKKIWMPEKNALMFTYRKGGWAAGGMAICIINLQNGSIIHDQYIVPTKKK